MKKNYNFMIIGVLFMASIITELYFLLEFRENITLITGGGLIVLLTTYLLFDWIYEFRYNAKNNDKAEDDFKLNNKLFEDILKFEKASYLTLHQLIDSDDEKYEEFLQQLEIYKEEIIEAANNAAKLEAKYHREDIKYITKNIKSSSSKIALSIEKIAEKSTVQEIIDGVTQSITNLEETVQKIEELLERGLIIQNEYEAVKEIKENTNKMVEIKAEDDSFKEYLNNEEEKVEFEPETILEEKVFEINSNLEEKASEVLEKEGKQEEKPKEDPNKQMSAEEIAALFASMK